MPSSYSLLTFVAPVCFCLQLANQKALSNLFFDGSFVCLLYNTDLAVLVIAEKAFTFSPMSVCLSVNRITQNLIINTVNSSFNVKKLCVNTTAKMLLQIERERQRQRERERDRERERERETETDRDRDRQTDRQSERQVLNP